MNVVFFVRHFYPHIGGVEKHLLKISEILSKKHTITVVTEQHDPSLPLKDRYDGITIYRIPIKGNEKRKKFEIWKYIYNHREIIRSSDIIHIHDVFFWFLPFRFLYPTKKVFMTFHGYEGNSLPTRRAFLSHKIAEVLSQGNICIGDYLSKWYKTRPTIVSYGGVSPMRATNLPEVIPFGKKLQILYIGRLEKEAGIMEYLRLIKKCTESGQRLTLTVLGNGSQYTQAFSYVKRYKLPVVFKGFVPEVEKYIGRFDIVFTSRYLGTLESMLYKKPVLCVYNNAIKRDCFVMAPFSDWIYLAANIDEMHRQFNELVNDEKQREKRVTQGYRWVKQETWNKMANHYLTLWRV